MLILTVITTFGFSCLYLSILSLIAYEKKDTTSGNIAIVLSFVSLFICTLGINALIGGR